LRPYQAHALRAVSGPACESCKTATWLVSIEPDKPAHDRRTFECPRCQHLMIEIIQYEKADEVG
jgi:hypothetical protein